MQHHIIFKEILLCHRFISYINISFCFHNPSRDCEQNTVQYWHLNELNSDTNNSSFTFQLFNSGSCRIHPTSKIHSYLPRKPHVQSSNTSCWARFTSCQTKTTLFSTTSIHKMVHMKRYGMTIIYPKWCLSKGTWGSGNPRASQMSIVLSWKHILVLITQNLRISF